MAAVITVSPGGAAAARNSVKKSLISGMRTTRSHAADRGRLSDARGERNFAGDGGPGGALPGNLDRGAGTGGAPGRRGFCRDCLSLPAAGDEVFRSRPFAAGPAAKGSRDGKAGAQVSDGAGGAEPVVFPAVRSGTADGCGGGAGGDGGGEEVPGALGPRAERGGEAGISAGGGGGGVELAGDGGGENDGARGAGGGQGGDCGFRITHLGEAQADDRVRRECGDQRERGGGAAVPGGRPDACGLAGVVSRGAGVRRRERDRRCHREVRRGESTACAPQGTPLRLDRGTDRQR